MCFSHLTILELIILTVFAQDHKFRFSLPYYFLFQILLSYLVFELPQSLFIPPYENQRFTNTFILGG